jgi:hypothetical protein
VERGDIGSWLGGQAPSEASTRGQRLDLPATGPGSLAGTWRRVVALFIDWTAAGLISRLAVDAPTPGSQSLVTMGFFALEVTLLTWLASASFGQRLVGIRVVGLSDRLGLIRCALRTVLICLLIPPLIWDADGRGLHDRAVNSVVVRG